MIKAAVAGGVFPNLALLLDNANYSLSHRRARALFFATQTLSRALIFDTIVLNTSITFTGGLMQLSKRQTMNRIYRDICGFEIPKDDEKNVRHSKGSPIYGEINLAAMGKLFDAIKLSSSDTLYDLGAGVGKVILYAGLFTPVKKAVGVELSKTRHDDSLLALKRAQEMQQKIDHRCRFINADLLTMDLSDASVVYTCSTAFSRDFMRSVAQFLGQFNQPFRLVSLQDLPNARYFELVDRINLDMSWQRNTPVHIYQRRNK